ncbi:3-hydroxyacyl-CoA dehydrogenase NAD-binding domain-containing protein [Paracoccaceae bacterium]|nr:3-hydroxyacyl-CoA dehydrogenase NAD-binding domain-containing protein [Paracoccaceae bacterium]
MQNINGIVSVEINNKIALICLDNPPVNAASQALRDGLQKALIWASSQNDIGVIVIYGAGRTFVAGADIKEFGKQPLAPFLPDLVNEIEQAEIPVISVLHGTALGGGLEIALGTHARVGIEGLKVGLPEIHLGLLPGAGGTQRTPRLCGIPAALDMILSGRHIHAQEALEMGLIDKLYDGQPRDVAMEAAQEVLIGKLETHRTDQIITKSNNVHLDEVEARLLQTHSHLFSPHKCIEAVRACSLPIEEGLRIERQAFEECMETPQRAGLIHAFFGERSVSRVPESKIAPRQVEHIGIIGAGTMGSGIATTCLMAGLRVTLIENVQENLNEGTAKVKRNLQDSVKRGKLQAENLSKTQSLLQPALGIEYLDQVDLVIEAAFEDMDIKKEIFRKLDSVCKAGAILASNTSYLDINQIAAITSRPQDVIGLHFFSPAHVMRLLEIVVGKKTDPAVTATGFSLAKKLRKVGVKAGVCDGFIGNRILAHYRKTAAYLVLDGAHPQQVDQALESFGFAMGPYKVTDLAGLDIDWMTRRRKAPTRPKEERYSGEIADRICESGWFGRKSGQGYYLYKGRDIHTNPDIDAIINAERQKAGITVQKFNNKEIVKRYMTAMISEAVRVLEERIAARPLDVDMVFLFGYGFPRHRGGPLHYADTLGPQELISRIETYAKEDSHYWKVPDMLRQMALDGTKFSDLNG